MDGDCRAVSPISFTCLVRTREWLRPASASMTPFLLKYGCRFDRTFISAK